MTAHECARIEELISARMDGATTPEEDARIERHLDGCAACRATALAFSRVDREVGDYLRATPVPAIATPWREGRRAPLAIPGGFARWRPATIALTTILVLVVASVLAFGAFRGNGGQTRETSAPQSAYTSGGAAPGAASAVPSMAPSTAAGAAPRSAASAAPTAAAASSAPAAPALAPPVPAERATAASGVPAASSAPAAGGAASGAASTPSRVPMLASADPNATLNPVQHLRLGTATTLSVCSPDCVASPQGATTLTEVLALLDTPLKRVQPATPTTTTDAAATVLRFTLADGQTVELRYAAASNQLTLPDGAVLLAPDALRDAIAAPVRLP